MPINSVTLIGNLVEDPELRFTPSGVAMAKLRFAVNRRFQDRNSEWQEETSFFGGTVWREMAEAVAESLTKGTRVIVTGSLEQRSWETQEGEKRTVVEVIADGLGPSLRWAQAQVEKTSRTTAEGGAPAPAGGGGRAPDPVYGDEEPF